MIRRGLILLGGLLLLSYPARGQGVDLLTSTQEPLKETVKLRATLGDELHGYVIFYIDGEFRKAASYPYDYTWDTKKEPEGEHKILLIGHDSAGNVTGEKEFTVQVQNMLPASVTPPEGILLRIGLRPEQVQHYYLQAKGVADILQGEQFLGNARQLEINTEVWWQDRVLFVTSEGQATVRRKVKNGYVDFAISRSQVRGVAQGFTLIMDALGHVRPRRQANYFGYGDISLVFPDHRVQVGDTWESEIRIIPEVETQEPVKLKARHVLEAIEWIKGYRCARIRSTYNGDVTFNLRAGNNLLPVTAHTEGTRTTYFAYEERKFIRADDEATHEAEVEASQLGVQTGGAGMPATGGFGGPAGLPGGGFGQVASGPSGGMFPPMGSMPGMGGPYGGAMPGGMGAFPGPPGSMYPGMGGTSGMTSPSAGAPPWVGGGAASQGAAGGQLRMPGSKMRDMERSINGDISIPTDLDLQPDLDSSITRQKQLPMIGGPSPGQSTGTGPTAGPPGGGATSPYGSTMPPYGSGLSPYGGSMPPYGSGMSPYGGSMPPYGSGMSPYGGSMPPYGSGVSPYGGSMPPFGAAGPLTGMGGLGATGATGGTAVPQTIRVRYTVKLKVELQEGDEIGPPEPRTEAIAYAGRLR